MGRWLHPLLVPVAQITKYLSSFSSSIPCPCLYLPPRRMHFIQLRSLSIQIQSFHTLLLQPFIVSVHQMCLSKWLRLQPKAKQHSWSGVMLQRLFQPLDKIKIDIIKAFSSSNNPFKVIWTFVFSATSEVAYSLTGILCLAKMVPVWLNGKLVSYLHTSWVLFLSSYSILSLHGASVWKYTFSFPSLYFTNIKGVSFHG